MTPRQHGDTEAKLSGFEARLQDGFDWANAHGREVIAGLALLFVAGSIAAGVYEWRKRSLAEGDAELARIEARFTQAMGATANDTFITEPANADQAKKAREASLAELDAFIAAHGLSVDQAKIASLRAAEIEVDLGRLPDADKRLEALGAAFASDDPRRAVALRLRGYVLDQSGNSLGAAEVYQTAAEVKAYPPRALLFVKAGEAFARAGAPARAIAAYRQALATSPEVAEQEGIVGRIGVQQALLDAATPPPAAPPASAPASDK
jgi:tetratricopeptide (TPR) repeat protein